MTFSGSELRSLIFYKTSIYLKIIYHATPTLIISRILIKHSVNKKKSFFFNLSYSFEGKKKIIFFHYFLVFCPKMFMKKKSKQHIAFYSLLSCTDRLHSGFTIHWILKRERSRECSMCKYWKIYTCCTNTCHSHRSLFVQKTVMVISGKWFPITLNGLPVYRDTKSLSEIIRQIQSLSVTTIIHCLQKHVGAL